MGIVETLEGDVGGFLTVLPLLDLLVVPVGRLVTFGGGLVYRVGFVVGMLVNGEDVGLLVVSGVGFVAGILDNFGEVFPPLGLLVVYRVGLFDVGILVTFGVGILDFNVGFSSIVDSVDGKLVMFLGGPL